MPMVRKLSKKAKVPTTTDRDAAAQAVHDMVGGARKKPKRVKGAKETVEKWQRETHGYMETGEWDEAKVQHLVALFILLHSWCYEVAPADMHGTELLAARSSANKLLKQEFGNDMSACVDYMKWVWKREKEREVWRRNKNVQGRVLRWRQVFMWGQVLTDYRIAIARSAQGGS